MRHLQKTDDNDDYDDENGNEFFLTMIVIIFQHLIDVCTETLAKNCSLQVLSEICREDHSLQTIFWQKKATKKTNE